MDPIGIALLGLGRAGSFHRESLRALPGARLCEVFDTDSGLAERVAREDGCHPAKDAASAIGAGGVDAVIVATPTRTHHEYVVAALEAGKAVLSEKPLGLDPAEIERCFEAAESRELPLLVAFQRRFDPSFGSLASAAHAGEVGELQFIRSVSRDNPVPSVDYIRTSGGIFHDCLVHDFDLICHIAKVGPEEVFSFGSSFLPEISAIDDLDNVVVSLRFPGGLLASVDASRKSVYGYDQRIEVFGSAGMLQTGNRPRTLTLQAGKGGVVAPPIDFSFPTRYRDAYRLELECFLECVRGEREAPVTRQDVLRTHGVADAAERSYREGQPVRIEPVV
jgi:myo-inositol 2-dehydrogenase/D-chiro-inositol 1-dehydrogenase